MNQFRKSLGADLVAGMLFVLPTYLAILLLLKAMKSIGAIVRPIARLLPHSFPAETIFSFIAVMAICLLAGVIFSTPWGRAAQTKIEDSLFQKIPGYEMVRGMSQQLAGRSEGRTWQPALAEIEEALVPAFIIEEHEDRRFTVFVPSVPTPLAGAVYILDAERVHPLNVPFTQAVKTVTRWGLGSKELVHAMQSEVHRR